MSKLPVNTIKNDIKSDIKNKEERSCGYYEYLWRGYDLTIIYEYCVVIIDLRWTEDNKDFYACNKLSINEFLGYSYKKIIYYINEILFYNTIECEIMRGSKY